MFAFDRAWLARPILSALGCGALIGVGCGGAVAPDSEYLGEPDDPIGGGGSATTGATGGRSPTGTGGRASTGTGGRRSTGGFGGTGTGIGGAGGVPGSAGSFGMAGSPSFPEPSICVGFGDLLGGVATEAFSIGDDATASAFCGGMYDPSLRYEIICFPRPFSGQSCSSFYPESLIGELYSCGLNERADFVCGPGAPPAGSAGCSGNECCYVLAGGCAVGRPFLVENEARTAASEPRADWLTRQQPDVRSLDPDTRRALADAYRQDGLTEHASVASFARFVLELLALGAPADLVAEAQAALADELEHARISFGLASAYAGAAVGPGALDVSGALAQAPDVRDCLRRAIREGCIAETVSASLIRSASQAAEDATVQALLERVASDERRHAVLAWRFARWLIAREGDSLAAVAAEEFAWAPQHVGFGALTQLPGDERALRAHGHLSENERRAVALQTLRQVVEPCARALLRGHGASQAQDLPESAPASA